jgi:probable F420-dependent oxidoreductase
MKFGIRPPTFAPKYANRSEPVTLDEMGAYLRRAEDLNIEGAFLIDHFLFAGPLYSCTWMENLTLLGALAGVTRTIRLGTSIIVLPLHHPVYFAKAWAGVDFLSGGRSILGVGVGWNEAEFASLGVPRKERGSRTTEILEALELLWSEDDVTYKGKHFQFENVTIEPKPIQRPRPPIWMAAGTPPKEKGFGIWAASPKADLSPVLKRLARFADVWNPPLYIEPDDLKRDWEVLTGLMEEYGRDPTKLGKAYGSWIHVLKPGEKPESAIPEYSQFSGQDMEFWREHYFLGEANEIVDKINEGVAAMGGIDWLLVSPLNWDQEHLEFLATEIFAKVDQ